MCTRLLYKFELCACQWVCTVCVCTCAATALLLFAMLNTKIQYVYCVHKIFPICWCFWIYFFFSFRLLLYWMICRHSFIGQSARVCLCLRKVVNFVLIGYNARLCQTIFNRFNFIFYYYDLWASVYRPICGICGTCGFYLSAERGTVVRNHLP